MSQRRKGQVRVNAGTDACHHFPQNPFKPMEAEFHTLLEIGFMHFVIFHFWINYTSDLPVKEEGPPQLGPELRSSHPSVSFPLVKPQSRLLEESKKMRTLLTTQMTKPWQAKSKLKKMSSDMGVHSSMARMLV